MKTKPSTSILLAMTALSLAGTGPTLVHAQAAATTTSVRIPLPQPFQRLVPCAANGAGELIDLSGTLHLLFHTTLDGSGGFRTAFQANPQEVTGIGLTTGDVYRGTGMRREQTNGALGIIGAEYSLVINNFRLIGPGPDNNLLIHGTFHVTVNANGVVTAYVNSFSIECR